MSHSLTVRLFLDSTATPPEAIYGDDNVPVIRVENYPATFNIHCLSSQPAAQYAALHALAAACEELAEAILQRSMAASHTSAEA